MTAFFFARDTKNAPEARFQPVQELQIKPEIFYSILITDSFHNLF